MRLLNTDTGLFEWFNDPRTVRYAILSHVWSKGNHGDPSYIPEQTFQDIIKIQDNARSWSFFRRFRSKRSRHLLTKMSEKVRSACRVAREHGFRYIWIDSCCINKASSAELTEAINSMFDWYRYASVCFAHLDDVDDDEDPAATDSGFRRSGWFKRGWTLQELIAPETLLFMSKGWSLIGTKYRLASVIEEATRIDSAVLRHEKSLSDVNVARRMSWASERMTTLLEDEAYALMGLFGVHLTLLYGEGGQAFVRLQEAILKEIPDQTIFAWGGINEDSDFSFSFGDEPVTDTPLTMNRKITVSRSHEASYLLASSPEGFEKCSNLVVVPHRWFSDTLFVLGYDMRYPAYVTTPYGIHTQLPVVPIYDDTGARYLLALLACRDLQTGHLLALLLRHSTSETSSGALVGALINAPTDIDITKPHTTLPSILSRYYRLLQLSEDQVAHCKSSNLIQLTDVYLPRHIPRSLQALKRDGHLHRDVCECPNRELFQVKLADWCCTLLRKSGYMVSSRLSSQDKRQTPEFVISKGSDSIRLQVARCKCGRGRDDGWLRTKVVPQCHLTLPSSSPDYQCSVWQDHIYSWNLRGGIAWQVFEFDTALTLGRGLRLMLSSEVCPDRTRTFILDVEILDVPNVDPPLHHPISTGTSSLLRFSDQVLDSSSIVRRTYHTKDNFPPLDLGPSFLDVALLSGGRVADSDSDIQAKPSVVVHHRTYSDAYSRLRDSASFCPPGSYTDRLHSSSFRVSRERQSLYSASQHALSFKSNTERKLPRSNDSSSYDRRGQRSRIPTRVARAGLPQLTSGHDSSGRAIFSHCERPGRSRSLASQIQSSREYAPDPPSARDDSIRARHAAQHGSLSPDSFMFAVDAPLLPTYLHRYADSPDLLSLATHDTTPGATLYADERISWPMNLSSSRAQRSGEMQGRSPSPESIARAQWEQDQTLVGDVASRRRAEWTPRKQVGEFGISTPKADMSTTSTESVTLWKTSMSSIPRVTRRGSEKKDGPPENTWLRDTALDAPTTIRTASDNDDLSNSIEEFYWDIIDML